MRTSGLPRTAAAAQKMGLAEMPYENITDADRQRMIPMATAGRRKGALALVIPPEIPPQITSGPRPDTYIVCYYNSVGNRYDLGCHVISGDQLRSGAF